MILNCKVTGLYSGSEFTDKEARATIRVAECDTVARSIRLKLKDLPPGISLDDTFQLMLATADDIASSLITEMEKS